MGKLYYFVSFEGKIQMEEIQKEEIQIEEIQKSELKDVKELQEMSVSDIFLKCSISKSMPISFDRIGKTYRVNIMGTDFTLISQMEKVREHIQDKRKILGMVNIENGCANIYYNNNSEINIPLQRFTIAHELAHCIFHYDMLSEKGKVEFLDEDFESDTPNDERMMREYVCNKFARDFLIPTDLLKKVYSMTNNVRAKDFAELFLVPEKEMKIKLEEIGLSYR